MLKHRNERLAVGFSCSSPTKHANHYHTGAAAMNHLPPGLIQHSPYSGVKITTAVAKSMAGPFGGSENRSACRYPFHRRPMPHTTATTAVKAIATITATTPAQTATTMPNGTANLIAPPPMPCPWLEIASTRDSDDQIRPHNQHTRRDIIIDADA